MKVSMEGLLLKISDFKRFGPSKRQDEDLNGKLLLKMKDLTRVESSRSPVEIKITIWGSRGQDKDLHGSRLFKHEDLD